MIKNTVEQDTAQFYTLKCGNGMEIVKDPVEAAVLSCIADCKPENASIGGYSWDEIGMSALFAKCYYEKLRYCDHAEYWYVYNGVTLEKDDSKKSVNAHAAVMQFISLLGKYSYQFVGDESKTAFIRKVSTFTDRRFRGRMLDDAASQMTIKPEQFDSLPYLLNCTNGTYDLRTGEFRKTAVEYFLTQKTNCSGSILPLSFPCWEQFINEVCENDKEKAAYLQRAVNRPRNSRHE